MRARVGCQPVGVGGVGGMMSSAIGSVPVGRYLILLNRKVKIRGIKSDDIHVIG